jgi:hypothetical protein
LGHGLSWGQNPILGLRGRTAFHNYVLTILRDGASVQITPLHLAGAFTRIPKIAPAYNQVRVRIQPVVRGRKRRWQRG